MKFGAEVKAVGTVAHSFIEFFPTEFDAFKAFADTYPDSVSLLLDTYNIMESGLPNLIKLDDYLIEKYPNDPNRRVKSARIDSGDLARGSKRLRKALDAAGKPYIKLVASNGLDEKKIANMELYEHAHFDSYGVGENLITSASDPVFGGGVQAGGGQAAGRQLHSQDEVLGFRQQGHHSGQEDAVAPLR